MSDQSGLSNMAIFCDFENIAIGVREAKYSQFNIEKVLERLLVKGNIVVKKAYCDWTRYQSYKRGMHEAAFELIDIPHLSQSGKNSADIRMVVDALDLCYTKSHVDSFVVVSGDSDFSPLVAKLRENDKLVIGVGVKHSTSDLLVGSCDQFIFYDDLVREEKPRKSSKTPQRKSTKNGGQERSEKMDKAVTLVAETVETMLEERGTEDRIWGSMVKQAIKRRKPGFNERYHGFRSFNTLLEEAEDRGLLRLTADEKSGGYLVTMGKGEDESNGN